MKSKITKQLEDVVKKEFYRQYGLSEHDNSKYAVKGGIVVEVDSGVSRKQRKSVKKKYCATKYMDI